MVVGSRRVPGPRARHGRVELAAAVVVVVVSSAYLGRMVRTAAHVSLWNDELFSVIRTSGVGPGHTITSYASANNHVFFNLVNALTPGAGSVDPLHARWWSIVAVLAMLAIGLHEFVRRRWYLAGAGFFALLATSGNLLDLALQARGYGILALAALVSCTTVWRYLEEPRRRDLAVLGGATLVGTWTVPSFVLFGAPVWLALLIAVRRREVVAAGLLTTAAIAAVYAPIVGEVRSEMASYGEQWGRHYTNLDDVALTLRTYLLHSEAFPGRSLGTVLPLSVGLVTVIAAFVLPVGAEVRRLVVVLMGATTGFFALNLWMGTSVLRTTAFVVVPFAFAVTAVVGGVLERVPPPDRTRPAGAAVLGIGLLVLVVGVSLPGVRRPPVYLRLPLQDWQGAGAYVDRTFPEGSGLACTHDSPDGILRGAYVEGRFPSDLRPDPSPGLATGRTVLIDISIAGPPAYEFERVASAYSEARFRQRIGDYVRVLAAPPQVAHVAAVQVDGRGVDVATLVDRDGATGPSPPKAVDTVRIVPTPGLVARSVVLVSGSPLPDVASVRVVLGGRVEVIPSSSVTAYGRSVTVALGDRPVQAVEVTFHAPSSGRRVDLREVWAYPTRAFVLVGASL